MLKDKNCYIYGFVTCALLVITPACFNAIKETKNFLVVNVLNKPDCLIKGSVNVPFTDFEYYIQSQLSSGDINYETEIVVYCSNYLCSASGAAWRYLKAQGFTNCWAYEAGMAGWYQAQLPIEGACESVYLTAKNEPLGPHADDVRVITTEQLKEKMEKWVYTKDTDT